MSRTGKSAIQKHSVVINGHHTSISLEDAFLQALDEIARSRRITRQDLISAIARGKQEGVGLSTALRLHALEYFRAKCQQMQTSPPPAQTSPGK